MKPHAKIEVIEQITTILYSETLNYPENPLTIVKLPFRDNIAGDIARFHESESRECVCACVVVVVLVPLTETIV